MDINGRFVISMLCAVFFLTVLTGRAEAESTPMNYTASGAFGSSAFTFPDGKRATSINLVGTSTSGPVTVREWAAGNFTGKCTPQSGTPNAGSLVTFADSLAVITFESTGAQLVQNLVSGTECIDFTSGPPFPFAGVLTVENTGGTGKFAGATGTENLNFGGEFLSCGSTGCVGFVQHIETGRAETP